MTDKYLLLSQIESLKREHYYDDNDCWYSCPLSEEGTCNEMKVPNTCDCGVPTHNEFIDEIIRSVQELVDEIEDPPCCASCDGWQCEY